MAFKRQPFRMQDCVRDVPASELAENLWSDCTGMIFRNGEAQRQGGEDSLVPLNAPLHVMNAPGPGPGTRDNVNTVLAVYAASGTPTTTKVYHYDGVNTTQTIYSSGQENGRPNDVTSALLGDLPIINFYSEDASVENFAAPIAWGRGFTGSAPDNMDELDGYEPLGTHADIRAAAVVTFKQSIFLMNLTDGGGSPVNQPSKLRWSTPVAYGSLPQSADWTPADDNSAGDAWLDATAGAIVHGCALRDRLLIFKDQSTYTCDFIGGNFVFDLTPVFPTIGLFDRNCCVEYGGLVYFIGQYDVFATDGVTVKSIIDQKNRLALFDSIPDNYGCVWMAANPQQNEIWIGFATDTNPYAQEAFVYDIGNGTWGHRVLSDVAHAHSARRIDGLGWTGGSSQMLLACYTDDDVAVADTRANNVSNTAINGILQRTDLTFGDANQRKLVTRIWPRIGQADNGDVISVRIGGRDNLDDAITWNSANTFTVGTDDYISDEANWRYIAIEFSGDDGYWSLPGFDLEWKYTGRY